MALPLRTMAGDIAKSTVMVVILLCHSYLLMLFLLLLLFLVWNSLLNLFPKSKFKRYERGWRRAQPSSALAVLRDDLGLVHNTHKS